VSLGRRTIRPLRDRTGEWLHALIDRRVSERLARELPALEQRVYERVRSAALREHQVFGPADRLRIAPTAQVNDALFNTVSGRITVGEHAFFGHGVAILTGTHDVDATGPARSHAIPTAGRDVEIGAGAWVSSRALVLGPARIGADAVVAAGAVVTADVPPGAIVAGVPARVVGHVDGSGGIPPAVDVATDVGRMYAHAHDTVITPALAAGGYGDEPEIRALRERLRPGMTVLDVGANVGYVTLLAAAAVGPKGHVVAVEPHPANVRLLRANVARHELRHVEIVASAALATSGTADLSECGDNTGDHRVGALTDERRVLRVPVRRLDDCVPADRQVDVIKLDTQATEHLALAGAARILEQWRPVIYAEYWPEGLRVRGDDPAAVLRGYRDRGYAPRVLEEPAVAASAGDDELIAAVDARPAPFGGFVTLELLPVGRPA